MHETKFNIRANSPLLPLSSVKKRGIFQGAYSIKAKLEVPPKNPCSAVNSYFVSYSASHTLCSTLPMLYAS